MKKLLIAPALLACLALGATSCKENKDKVKADFMKKCETEMAATVGANPAMKDAMHNYCQCSGDKLVEKFSESEMKAMEKMTPTEQQAKLMPVIQTCVDDLQKAMMQNAANAMPAQ